VSDHADRTVDEADLDALFAAPPASFVDARKAIAKKAREAGQRDRALRIDALRKPTMVVWLVNQLAREHRDEVAALLAAGRRIRKASLEGAGPGPLREANEAWRAAVARALQAIRGIAGRGIDEPRIVATLTGAVADPAHANRFSRGRLTDELEPPGLEGVLGRLAKAPSRPRAAARRRTGEAASGAVRRAERRRQREAARRLRERERDAEKARKEALHAAEVAARLEQRAKAAADQAALARQAADEAARRAEALAAKTRPPG